MYTACQKAVPLIARHILLKHKSIPHFLSSILKIGVKKAGRN